MTKRKAGKDEPGLDESNQAGAEQRVASLSFEGAMGELESIVRRLEGGGESLEEALDGYSNAIGLLKVCHRKLAEAERRVEILSGIDADGNPVTEPIEETQESLEQKRHSRSEKRSAGAKRSTKTAAGQSERKPKNSSEQGLF